MTIDFQKWIDFYHEFVGTSGDRWILTFVAFMIVFFSTVIIVLFFSALFIRIRSLKKRKRNRIHANNWTPNILNVMDGRVLPEKAYENMKYKRSINYILYLTSYIDNLKGKEKERIKTLASMSSKRINHLIRDIDHEHRLFGIRLMSVLTPEEQYQHMEFLLEDKKDPELTLIALREVCQSRDSHIAHLIIRNLSYFHYLNPVYLSTILAEFGSTIVSNIFAELQNPGWSPREQTVMIETVRRLHSRVCLQLTTGILRSKNEPMILAAWLRYIETVAGSEYHVYVRTMLHHGNEKVRVAAARAYIATAEEISYMDIANFFDDVSIWVPINAAHKLNTMNLKTKVPDHIVASLKHADVYRNMVKE